MTCIAENRRPGKIIVDYTDAGGRRRWATFPKTKEGRTLARIFAGEQERNLIRGELTQDDKITFKDASERWLLHCKASLTYQTWENYSVAIRRHLVPRFGSRPLVKVTRAAFKLYVAEVLAEGKQARGSVATRVGIARSFYSWCVEEGLASSNPAERVMKALKLGLRKGRVVKAMTREQLGAFLGASVRVLNEDGHLELLVLARTAVRLGEAHGLQWSDFLDEDPPRVRIDRQVTQHALIQAPKTEKGRRLVDISLDLRDALREVWARRHEERLRLGVPMGPWICHPEWPETPSKANVRLARKRVALNMAEVIAAANLPKFTPHGLRHTHATLLLLQGEPVQYVQQQLGHATIAETVDTYGSWIQAESPGAADRLANQTRAKELADVESFKSSAISHG